MTKLYHRTNSDNMEVYIIIGDKGFHVIPKDMDSGMVAGAICCPDYDMAVRKADELIGKVQP